MPSTICSRDIFFLLFLSSELQFKSTGSTGKATDWSWAPTGISHPATSGPAARTVRCAFGTSAREVSCPHPVGRHVNRMRSMRNGSLTSSRSCGCWRRTVVVARPSTHDACICIFQLRASMPPMQWWSPRPVGRSPSTTAGNSPTVSATPECPSSAAIAHWRECHSARAAPRAQSRSRTIPHWCAHPASQGTADRRIWQRRKWRRQLIFPAPHPLANAAMVTVRQQCSCCRHAQCPLRYPDVGEHLCCSVPVHCPWCKFAFWMPANIAMWMWRRK